MIYCPQYQLAYITPQAEEEKTRQLSGRAFIDFVVDKTDIRPNYRGNAAELAKVMRQCAVFAMPSIYETFGLVYLEALSQNLPVIYTRGQGIDGLFDNTVGIGTDPKSVEEICFSIKSILENHIYAISGAYIRA